MNFETKVSTSHHEDAARAGYPLTSVQMPIWLDELFFPDKPIANTGVLVTMTGPLDARIFAEAVRQVVQETEALRLHLRMEDQEVRQTVEELSDYAIQQIDLSGQPDPDAAVQQYIEERF